MKKNNKKLLIIIGVVTIVLIFGIFLAIKINSNSSRDFLFYNQTDKEKSINDFTIETISDC